jgi:hypothetical protein
MRITKCTHVTQTEKKHLKKFLDSGLTNAKINTKFYSVISGMIQGNEFIYKIRISSPTKNDYGVKKYESQLIEVAKTI